MMEDRLALLGRGQSEAVPAERFGNKASMLARIDSLSIRIPPAFVLGVAICEDYFSNGRKLPPDTQDLLRKGISYLEEVTGKRFSDPKRPLLVSVRSGAPVSMPGMMSTILNVGLTREGVEGLIAESGNPRFGWDCYRRLITSYGEAVRGQDKRVYDKLLDKRLKNQGLNDETELDSYSLKAVADEFEGVFNRSKGGPFPQEPERQLNESVCSVLDSWSSPRAENYRKLNPTLAARGTAVTVQAMVFGNMGFLSGSGVSFTRNPLTGVNETMVDFRFGVQGENVVSGEQEADQEHLLRKILPDVHQELLKAGKDLEAHLKDMQDIEFTVQEGTLYLLQTRDGKRSPMAALKIAVDLANEGIVPPSKAMERLRGIDLSSIVDQKVVSGSAPLAIGMPASIGIVTGEIALTNAKAIERNKEGPVILVKETLSPDDISAILASAGIVTVRGNRMAHAVVVARQLGKGCVVKVADLSIDLNRHLIRIGTMELPEGAVLSLDSLTGAIYEGRVQIVQERPTELIEWVEREKALAQMHPRAD
jgi:pyruvate, orthophosphate dikinase